MKKDNYSFSLPLITVIMPVYNAQSFLKDSIESILNQTYSNFEFLVFNDASTDSSLEIIQSYRDSRIKCIDSPLNSGYVHHLNRGLKMARGKYIARMDADDISLPERFQYQFNLMESNPSIVLCGTDINFIGSRKGRVRFPIDHADIVTQFILKGNAIAHPSVMMRTSVIHQFNIEYDQSLEPAEDYDMWVRLSSFGTIVNIPEPMLQYRVHDNNESIIKKEKQEQAVFITRKKLFQSLDNQIIDSNLDLICGFFSPGQHQRGPYDANQMRILIYVYKYLLNNKRLNSLFVKNLIEDQFTNSLKILKVSRISRLIHYLKLPKRKISLRVALSFFNSK
jgi:glycosyltransferase involved in cell wall biosynthesis